MIHNDFLFVYVNPCNGFFVLNTPSVRTSVFDQIFMLEPLNADDFPTFHVETPRPELVFAVAKVTL